MRREVEVRECRQTGGMGAALHCSAQHRTERDMAYDLLGGGGVRQAAHSDDAVAAARDLREELPALRRLPCNIRTQTSICTVHSSNIWSALYNVHTDD